MKYLYRGLVMAGCLLSMSASAKALTVGQQLPLSAICQDKEVTSQTDWQSLKLVVVLPEQSDYDGMMKYAFNQYFTFENAFNRNDNHYHNIKIIYITGAQTDQNTSFTIG